MSDTNNNKVEKNNDERLLNKAETERIEKLCIQRARKEEKLNQ